MAFEQQEKALISAFEAKERSVMETFTSVKIESLREFRASAPDTTSVDGPKLYKTVGDYDSKRMHLSFIRFHNALDMWAKHPRVNDALLMKSAFEDYVSSPKPILTEVLCTRGPKALVGARNIFRQLDGFTLEKRIESCIPQHLEHKVLRVLCFGIPRKAQTDDEAKDLVINARVIFEAMRSGGPNEDENGSESDIQVNLDPTNEIKWDESDSLETLMGKYEMVHKTKLEKDVNYGAFEKILKIRRDPVSYFVDVLGKAFETNNTDALMRVIVTRALVDMKRIKKVFSKKYGITLKSRVDGLGPGCFKDFLLMLLSYSGGD